MTRPHWLVVDLGGVAARYRPERRSRALAELTGLSEHDIDERLFASGFEGRAELGVIAPASIVDQVRGQLRRPIDEADLLAAWSLAFEPDEQVLELVATAGLPACLFTNNGPMLDRCLEHHLRAVSAVFDEVVCSWHLGLTKPDPAAFAAVAERLGGLAAALLFVDDSPDNVAAANEAGWSAVIHRGPDQLVQTLAASGVDPAPERRSIRPDRQGPGPTGGAVGTAAPDQ